MELFMYNDARLLSGASRHGSAGACRGSYESRIVGIDDPRNGITTEYLEQMNSTNNANSPMYLAGRAMVLHSGRSGYHSSENRYNNFLDAKTYPSVGVELETMIRPKVRSTTAMERLASNWFHFEYDGSLGDDGYELITEPLPPRVYRDVRTWLALDNLISPYLESYSHSETGLHVHVGLDQFEQFDDIPLRSKSTRRLIGAYVSTLVYYYLASRSIIDRVCLRNNTGYCAQACSGALKHYGELLDRGTCTGADIVDMATALALMCDTYTWRSAIGESDSNSMNVEYGARMSEMCSHHTEVNISHQHTVEFRRGKGTCHGLSIHRMVEFLSGVVRYAGKCCREREAIVSRQAFLDYQSRTTKSNALRKLIEEGTNNKEIQNNVCDTTCACEEAHKA